MSKPRVPGDLWEAIEPLLPKERLLAWLLVNRDKLSSRRR
jgi:hypothetical protein